MLRTRFFILLPPLFCEIAVQERDDLAAGAGVVRAEMRGVHAVRDLVLHCPEDRVGVVFTGGDVRERIIRSCCRLYSNGKRNVEVLTLNS